MNYSDRDIFLLLSSSLELHRYKVLIKRLYSSINNLNDILNGDLKNIKLSFEDREKLEYIKSEVEKLNLEEIKNTLKQKRISFISFADENYLKKLKDISDSPLGFFYIGDLSVLNIVSVGIVGTRNPTSYGTRITKRITELFVEKNIVIVSGLANGIDSCAHETSLKSGKTIAVLGTGLDEIYPQENYSLFERIVSKGGLVISEYPPNTPGMPWNFPQRNRIISALSDAIVVVEGNAQSGALITARFAIKQDKPLFAIPGPIDSPESNGPNLLIKSKVADVLTSIDDVLEKILDYKVNGKQIKFDLEKNSKSLDELSENQKSIYKILSKDSRNFDNLVNETDLNIQELTNALSMLELKGFVEKSSSGGYRTVDN